MNNGCLSSIPPNPKKKKKDLARGLILDFSHNAELENRKLWGQVNVCKNHEYKYNQIHNALNIYSPFILRSSIKPHRASF